MENQPTNNNVYYQDIENNNSNNNTHLIPNYPRPLNYNYETNYSPPVGLKYSLSKQLIQLGCIPKSVLVLLQSNEKSIFAQCLLKLDQFDYYISLLLR